MYSGSDKFSIDKLVPNPTSESMFSFIQEIVKTSQLERTNSERRKIQFATSQEKEAFDSYFEFWGNNAEIRKTKLGECCCNDDIHNRFANGNTRKKIENAIMEGISNLPNKDSISLLSVGSGTFLQDLIILFRLFLQGYKKIAITCVEPDLDDEAYEHFKTIIQAVNQYCNAEIEIHCYKNIDDVPKESRNFDVVYAIDYDNFEFGKDFSSRKLQGREGTFEAETYLAAMAMIKGLSFLTQDKGAFAAYSQHQYMSFFSVSNPGITLTDKIDTLVFSPNTYDEYCINSSLEVLVANLSFFIKEQKPLLINEEIIQEMDKPFVEALLTQFNIPYSFFNYADIKKDAYTDEKLRLVVDWIAFDAKKGEKNEVTGFEGKNNTIVRTDCCDNKSLTTSKVSLHAQLIELCGEKQGIIDFLKQYLQKQGKEKAQLMMNEWKNQGVVINAKFLGNITRALLGDVVKNANDIQLNILTTPCYTYEDYNTAFFEKVDTLQDYLEELLVFPNYPKLNVVIPLINYLENKNYAVMAEYLQKTPKGKMVWDSIISEHPEIIDKNTRTIKNQ